MIATAYLAEHELFQSRPPFWRRWAAATHAALIVRACGVSSDDYSNLLRWTHSVAGKAYTLSIYADMADEPNWRPDWLRSNLMVADAVGRARAVLATMQSDLVPPGWQDCVSAADSWVAEKHLGPLTMLPSLLEGARRPTPALGEIFSPAAEELHEFIADPTADQLIRLAAFSYIFGFPDEARAKIPSSLEGARADARTFDDRDMQLACTVAAHLAAQTHDTDLAALTADVVLEKLHGATTREAMFQAICVLVECSAAIRDRDAGSLELASRLEHIARTYPTSAPLNDLATAIETLGNIQAPLAPLLARGAAAARLGAP